MHAVQLNRSFSKGDAQLLGHPHDLLGRQCGLLQGTNFDWTGGCCSLAKCSGKPVSTRHGSRQLRVPAGANWNRVEIGDSPDGLADCSLDNVVLWVLQSQVCKAGEDSRVEDMDVYARAYGAQQTLDDLCHDCAMVACSRL